MEMTSIAGIIKAGKELVAIIQEIRGLLPDSDQAKTLMLKLEEAEMKLNEQQALTAKALGFSLCQCTYPPQIMLYKHQSKTYNCASCGNTGSAAVLLSGGSYPVPPMLR